MIFIKKASIDDIDRLAMAIMVMKSSVECITRDEMYEYIDRTYYAQDSNNQVLAIVCANRRSIKYSNEATELGLYSTRYQIKYSLFNKHLIEENGYSCVRVMTKLVTELCADLNDWSVWIDVEFQAGINLGANKDDTIFVLTEAIMANDFKKAINRFGYIRVMPIDFLKTH